MKRTLTALLVLSVLAFGTAAFAQSLWARLGFTQGPVQPIKYSHAIHAGKLGMNCVYCHYGAEKSPVANMPPVSTCMGCHKIAMADRPEVQKLAAYWERNEPVPWVRVNQLPSYVRFNHKRHVAAGVQCMDCHGPVTTMDVYYQYQSLKMGWCVSCHRQRMNDPKFPTSMDCLICHH